MLLLNDISNLLTLMVTWDNFFQYQNIRVITHKMEDFKQLALFLFVWTTCSGRSYRLQKLFCTDTDLKENRHFQVWREILIEYSSLEYSEFILAFQLQLGTYDAESENFRWEKEKRHFNEWFSRQVDLLLVILLMFNFWSQYLRKS